MRHLQHLIRRTSTQHFVLSITLLLVFSIKASAQGYIYTESFPNTFNTGFTTPIASSAYAGSSGTWTFSSNDVATVVCNGAFYQSAPYAMKLVNGNNSTAPASTSRAVSPAYNMSAWGCSNKVDVFFRLYTYTLSSANSCYSFYVDFSADGGTTWATFYQKTAAQLIATFGANTWNDVWLAIPASYCTANFKVRFRGVQTNGCAYDSYVYIDDVKMYAEACPPACTGEVTNLYFNKLDGGTDLPISNGSTFTVAQLGSLYNMEAGTTGTVGSVKYTITGPTATSNIENTTPYNSPGTGSGAWTGAVGTYNVNLKTYSGADGTGTLCHDTTITFNLSNTTNNCSCPGTNVVLNPSFENGITSWSFAGGSLAAGTGGVACGNYSGDLNNTSASSKAWQTIGTDLAIGTTINVSVYAGTHDNTFNNYVAIEFLDAANVVLGTSVYTQIDKVLGNAPVGPQAYTLSAVVPNGTKFTRVAFGGNGTYTKTDQWCASTTPPVNTASIGDRVWLDADGDGIQDASETGGITGVTVQLKNSAGTVIATTTTNATGNYLFSGLAAGNYTVVFPVSISGAVVTGQNVGVDDNIDSDADQTTGATGVIVLATGQNITNVDAGYCPITLQIGNRVWNDVNNDGIDNSEAGIASVTVKLYKDDNNDNVPDGAAIATTTTNATGNYSFSNLAPGNYIVGVVTPAGLTSSTVNGGDPDNNTDLDDNGQVVSGTEIRGLAITLVAGTEPGGDINNTYDFGFYNALATGSIGDRVWLDADGDGIQDVSETGGITGVTVQLKNSAGTVIATTTTNATGNYLFTGLVAGNYTVVFPASISGAIVTGQNVGVDDNIDSDADQTTGATGVIVLATGQNITNVDAGYCPITLQLGNRVWYDANNDGLNGSENGIANATVKLYKDDNNDNVADGAAIATLTTDATGFYSFDNLGPGNYIVGVIIPNGYMSSSVNGGDPDNDINLDDNGQVFVGNEVRGLAITLVAGTEPDGTNTNTNNNITYDFGLLPDCSCTASANNLLVNGNFENGITGWSASGGTITTGTGFIACGIANGFNNWTAGTSKVWQDVNMAAGSTVTFSAFAGTHTPGLACAPKLSLIFLNASNVIIGQTDVAVTRDVDVNFGQLSQYTITATAPAGTVKARVESSITCNTMKLDAFCLTATAPPSFTLGNSVWYDINNNGAQDAGEPGIPGVVVKLYDCSGVYLNKTATTDANGNYQITGLPAGSYIVGVTTPAGYTKADAGTTNVGADNQNDGVNVVTTEIRTNCFTTTGSTNNIDFGLKGTGSIGDFVWNDLNANGLQDAGEPGIQGVVVTLTYPGGAIVTATTDINGAYSFINLAPGTTYSVSFATPAGYLVSPSNVGVNDNIDSDPVGGVVTNVTVVAGTANTTIDAGFYQSAKIGDFVWNDLDGDGIQDAGETGISGATVQLYTCAGVLVATTTTDANGAYSFSGLVPGSYYVKFTSPAGFTFSAADQGGDDTKDSDANPANGQTPCETLTSGENNTTYDAGLQSNQLVLGNFVWNDINNNGTQDVNEPGIVGATVKLYADANGDNIPDGAALQTTTTGAGGIYTFSGLTTGNYIVGVTIPAGYAAGATTATSIAPNNDNNTDNNGITNVAGEVRSNFITLTPAGEPTTDGDGNNGNLTLDFGLKGTGSIGDFVWNDLNANGLQDAGEPGIQGVVITLTHPGGATATATTDINGAYSFINLAPGTTYSVSFATPAGYLVSPSNAGADNIDSDPVGGVVTNVTVVAGTANTTIDAGFYQLGSIGDRIWKDDNGNGIQDAGEVGLAGVTVTLLNSAGQVVGTTTTDALGNYKFSNLPAGNYSLRITPPANYSLSAKTQGANTALDSDFDPISYTTGTVTLSSGQNRTDIDAGLKFTQTIGTSVGDRVWLDNNSDGIQDAGEPGVSNVLVTLYNSVGAPVASTYTDANGNYLFTGVAPGTYTVGVSLPPAFVFSPNNGALSIANNSDINPANGRTASFTVNAGDQITYVDAGLRTQQATNGSVGDYVWNDLNKDGVQNAGEPGIAGVTVRLVNATTNTIVATTTTDATGKYIFNDVVPGTYLVDFVTPAGYTITTRLNTNPVADVTDSDVNPSTSRTGSFSLGAGQRISSVDAGYWVTTPPGTAKLGDRVWLDGNQNGIQDAGEPGVAGVTVTLYDAGNIAIKQAVTDQNGLYIFTDLAAGNYTVGFTNIPAGFTFTTQGAGTAATGSDANPVTGKTGTIALGAGQTNLDVDAGIRSSMAGTASIGNKVFYDLNNNGIQDAGELGIQGITVELLDAAGNPIDKDPSTPGIQPTVTTTNALGEYLFTGLPAGDYRVRFSTLPAGYNAATKGAGTDRNIDSDGNPIVGGTSTTDVISVATGDERMDIDLGLFSPTAPLGQIGDKVFFDANNNGIQDATEQGVPGVSVALLDASGNVIRTTVTDGNGIYKFVNLADATYSVQFTNLPAGFTFSGKDLGANDALDSDADPVTGKTGTYVISGGNSNMTVDAGIYSTKAALGDYVWLDSNKDGIQDATESGVPGVTVTLYDAANVAIASAITDQSGKYFFSNLNPGTYIVGFTTIPSQLVFTAQDVVAAGDAADSDVNPATGKTGTVTLVAGQVNRTVDAGLKPYVPASIGDFVWYDLDRDGIQDAGEPGVAGIVVTLYNSANQPIGSAITDGNGYYNITNVPPGTGYYVQFSNKPNVTDTWTLQNVGGAGAVNNSKVNATGQTATFNVTEGQNISNLDAGLVKQINVSGNVWHDVNAMSDGFVNNSGALTTPPSQQIPANLFAFLVDDATGLVVAAEGVDPLTGKFNFENVAPNKEYYVVISRFYVDPGFPPPVSSLPAGWQNTGQNLGLDPGNDGLNDAKLFITVETTDVINVNFGIRLAGRDIVIG